MSGVNDLPLYRVESVSVNYADRLATVTGLHRYLVNLWLQHVLDVPFWYKYHSVTILSTFEQNQFARETNQRSGILIRINRVSLILARVHGVLSFTDEEV